MGSLYNRARERVEQAVLRCCYHYPVVNRILDRVMARGSKTLRRLNRPCDINVRLTPPESPQAAAIAVLPLIPPGEDNPFAGVDERNFHVLRFSKANGEAANFQEIEQEALEKSVSFRQLLADCLASASAPITTVIACCPTAVTRLLHNACRERGISFVYVAPAASTEKSPEYRSFSPPLADFVICDRSAEQEFAKLGYGAESLCAVDSPAMMPAAVKDIASRTIPIKRADPPIERLMAGRELAFPVIATNRGRQAATGEWQQKYIGPLFQASERLTVAEDADPGLYIGVDALLQWGPDYDYRRKNSTTDLLHGLQKGLGIPRLILENAFISSFDIGLKEPAKGIIVDDLAPYYHAGERSRLLDFLDSDREIGEEEKRVARRLIDRIVANKITKYNHAPRGEINIGPAGKAKILIVDQVFGDASIIYGGGGGDVFRRMLVEALGHADHDIILKLHPEATIGGRGTNYSQPLIRKACSLTGRDAGSVHVVQSEINPYSLLECVDKVFVVTSGMGFEALLAGKEVACFGRPFYSGWGFTVEKNQAGPRKRERGLEDVFHAICVLFSLYYHPEKKKVVGLDEYLDYFVATLSDSTSPLSRC